VRLNCVGEGKSFRILGKHVLAIEFGGLIIASPNAFHGTSRCSARVVSISPALVRAVKASPKVVANPRRLPWTRSVHRAEMRNGHGGATGRG
jgi:hypothetical protein